MHHIPVCSGLSQWQASKQAFLLKWHAFEIYGRAFEIQGLGQNESLSPHILIARHLNRGACLQATQR